jgi:hypothetical protein
VDTRGGMSSATAVFQTRGPTPSGIPTEVIIGLFALEAEQIWSDWNLLIWSIIKRRAVSKLVRSSNGTQRQANAVFCAGCYRRCTIEGFNGAATH